MIGFSEAAANPVTEDLTAVICRQMSKTEFLLNEIGRKVDEDPQPVIYVGPTEKAVKDMSTDRMAKMISNCPDLDMNHEKGHRDKTAEKWINSVRIGFAWAGSPTELQSHPAAMVLIDERDRMGDISEGDVDSIVGEAVATYSGIVIRVSTPLLGDVVREYNEDLKRDHWAKGDSGEIASPIWSRWQEGTRHEWHWPCPDCNEFFAPNLQLLKWDDKATPEELSQSAFIACPHCGSPHKDRAKDLMNARGVFLDPEDVIAPFKEGSDFALINGEEVRFGSYYDKGRTHVSFWVSGLCSPWRTFGQRAVALHKARISGKPSREQGIVNTLFGEVFKPKGQAPEWHLLKELIGTYKRREIPPGVQVLTAGVDVHLRRLNFVIRGWGPNFESWMIDYGELFGECRYLDDITWTQIREILNEMYGSKDLPITLMLVDSGYKPNDDPAPANLVYQFCYATKRALPAKGHDHRTRSHSASNIDINYKGKAVKNGLQLWHLDTNYFKSFIYSRYEYEEGLPGAWHLPADVEDEYLRQATAEAAIIRSNGTTKWDKIRQANHYLDCDVMNLAAAHILRLHMLKDPTTENKPAARKGRRVHRRR